MNFSRLLIIASGILLISLIVDAKKTDILDQDEASLDIERVAQVVCEVTKGAEKQISRFSTIQSLVDFFQSIPQDHKLAECAHQYLPAFEQMQLILSSANEDVCSDTKISLIESFHRNFVSKARKYRKEQKANQLVAPKLLRLFYMHYASAVSATCARSAKQELKEVNFSETTKGEEGNKLLKQFKDLFGQVDSSLKYRKMFLIWNFVNSLPMEDNPKLKQYLHNGKTHLYLQVHKAETFNTIQSFCLHKLKPFYSLSLLSVIRLADLGFYPEQEELAVMLSNNTDYTDLYTLLQLCETFLPLKVTENEKLEPNQIIVLSQDEIALLTETTEKDTEEVVTCINSSNKVNNIDTITDDEHNQNFIKRVKSNVDSRAQEQNKILKRLVQRFKKESSNHESGEFFFSQIAPEYDMEKLLSQSLPTADDSAPLIPEGGDNDEQELKTLARRKRGVMKTIRNTLANIVGGLLTVIYLAVWVALLVVKLLIIVPLSIFATLVEKTTKIELPSISRFNGICFRYELPKVHKKIHNMLHT